LPKLVYDNELCGQALHFLQPARLQNDIPAVDLARHVMAEQHLITAEHTLTHWPETMYLTGPTTDRTNRETWINQGSKSLLDRATEEVEQRLSAYTPIETDPLIDAELRTLIESGLTEGRPLPEIPEVRKPAAAADPRRQRKFKR